MSTPAARSIAPPQSAPLAEFRNVTKWYGPVIGVNDISVTLGPGITGLLGPNGAGKTTLIKLLTGQLHPSLGKVLVDGHNAISAMAKRRLGYCPDVDTFYGDWARRMARDLALPLGTSGDFAERRANELLDALSGGEFRAEEWAGDLGAELVRLALYEDEEERDV